MSDKLCFARRNLGSFGVQWNFGTFNTVEPCEIELGKVLYNIRVSSISSAVKSPIKDSLQLPAKDTLPFKAPKNTLFYILQEEDNLPTKDKLAGFGGI